MRDAYLPWMASQMKKIWRYKVVGLDIVPDIEFESRFHIDREALPPIHAFTADLAYKIRDDEDFVTNSKIKDSPIRITQRGALYPKFSDESLGGQPSKIPFGYDLQLEVASRSPSQEEEVRNIFYDAASSSSSDSPSPQYIHGAGMYGQTTLTDAQNNSVLPPINNKVYSLNAATLRHPDLTKSPRHNAVPMQNDCFVAAGDIVCDENICPTNVSGLQGSASKHEPTHSTDPAISAIFQFASSRPVNISTSARERGRELLDEIFESPTEADENQVTSTDTIELTNLNRGASADDDIFSSIKPGTFVFASGKEFKIDKEKLDNAMKLMGEIVEDETTVDNKPTESVPITDLPNERTQKEQAFHLSPGVLESCSPSQFFPSTQQILDNVNTSACLTNDSPHIKTDNLTNLKPKEAKDSVVCNLQLDETKENKSNHEAELSSNYKLRKRKTSFNTPGAVNKKVMCESKTNTDNTGLLLVTASGKPLATSEASMKAALSLFDDKEENILDCNVKHSPAIPESEAYHTPVNKIIKAPNLRKSLVPRGERLENNINVDSEDRLIKTTGFMKTESSCSSFKMPRTSRKFQTPAFKANHKASATPISASSEVKICKKDTKKKPIKTVEPGLLSSVLQSVNSKAKLNYRNVTSSWSFLNGFLSNKNLNIDEIKLASPTKKKEALLQKVESDMVKTLGSLCIGEQWIENASKLILWKLASMANLYQKLRHKLLTYDLLLDEIIRRYKWEIGDGNSSFLRRVLEQDEAPGRQMILCVASINQLQHGVQLELSDGLYFIKSVMDDHLAALVKDSRIMLATIYTGDKLRIKGAEINVTTQKDALEAYKSTFLKIYYNGTHRVSQNTPLGKSRTRSSILALPHILPFGGTVKRTVFVTLRKHPIAYFIKQGNGKNIVMTEKLYENTMSAYMREVYKVKEDTALCMQKDAKFNCSSETFSGHSQNEADDNVDLSKLERKRLASAENFEKELEFRLKAKLTEIGSHNIEAARPFLTLKIAPVLHKNLESYRGVSNIHEGEVYSVTNLTPGRSARRNILELSTSAKSYWQKILPSESSKLVYTYNPRTVVKLNELTSKHVGMSVDITGEIIHASDVCEDSYGSFSQWLFLADDSCTHESSWLLALNLRGEFQATQFLDNVQRSRGNVTTIKDLTLERQDDKNCLWQATGTELTLITSQNVRQSGSLQSGTKKLAEWSKDSEIIINQMLTRIKKLLNT